MSSFDRSEHETKKQIKCVQRRGEVENHDVANIQFGYPTTFVRRVVWYKDNSLHQVVAVCF